MRLSARAALVGALTSGHCPTCGSADIRPSRESYEGWLARKLRFQPYRCRSCRHHFAVAEGGLLRALRRPHPQPIARCRKCGSSDIAESQRERVTLFDRLLARRHMRCIACHARYRETDRVQLFATTLSLAVLAVALWFAAGLVSSRLGDTGAGKRPAKSSTRKK